MKFNFLKTDLHQFHPLSAADIQKVDAVFPIPAALKEFYAEVGYGFFHTADKNRFNRLLGPNSLHDINLRKNSYEFDPNLDFYEELYAGSKLIFLEIDELNHLAIDKTTEAIYYFSDKLADSLEEFLHMFDKDQFCYMDSE